MQRCSEAAATGIALRPCDPRHRWQRDSASGQMQEFAAGKFHDVPPGVAASECVWTLNVWLMKVTCLPTAPALPIAMIGISTRPAGSLGKMLHQLRDHTEGAIPTFLLQRMSPFMAQTRRFEAARACPLSGVKRTWPPSVTSSALDPKGTFLNLICCDAQCGPRS